MMVDNKLCPNDYDADFENFATSDLLMEGMLIIVQCIISAKHSLLRMHCSFDFHMMEDCLTFKVLEI